jgi:osmoprotectant transport system ATP-binding protein
VIELERVAKRYPGAGWVVREVSLAIADAELVCLLGESGSGKTTLLKMINRLIDPDEGRIRIAGRDIATGDPIQLRRSIGYVIQQVGLLPHLTVAENVATVPRLLGWTRREIADRVDELLELVALRELGDRLPAQLSGGQRQRVGVARALAARPRILLLDEPFGALDPITRVALQGELRRLHGELGLTTVMVTHDLAEALALADRIAVVHRGELRQVAAPAELIAAPADDRIARMIDVVRAQAARLARP